MATIAIVGAGITGLVCAQALQQQGHTVVVYEKSRGLGGRLATRRVGGTCADHGVRYLEPDGDLGQLMGVLHDRKIVRSWRGAIARLLPDGSCQMLSHSRRYVANEGMTAIAKWLAQGLTIHRHHRITAIVPESTGWTLNAEVSDHPPSQHSADRVVLTVPAPQAVALLTPLLSQGLPVSIVDAINAVTFEPCITAIATYDAERWDDLEHSQAWHGLLFEAHPDLAWISFENSKRPTLGQTHPVPQPSTLPVFIFQSTATFAEQHLNTVDLYPVGQHLLKQATQHLYEWMDTPVNLAVHRWRYAIASRPHPKTYISTQAPLPLVCAGDWCGGHQVIHAIHSGLDAAHAIHDQFSKSAPQRSFSDILTTICDRPTYLNDATS
jgi:predicted NAD/FAD-dependent oxidoreductase